jgi:hypothetical protein
MTKLQIGLPLRNEGQTYSGNRALPVRRTSLAFQAGFLPASRIALYANKNVERTGVLFPSPYSLLFASAEQPARGYSRCSSSAHQALPLSNPGAGAKLGPRDSYHGLPVSGLLLLFFKLHFVVRSVS